MRPATFLLSPEVTSYTAISATFRMWLCSFSILKWTKHRLTDLLYHVSLGDPQWIYAVLLLCFPEACQKIYQDHLLHRSQTTSSESSAVGTTAWNLLSHKYNSILITLKGSNQHWLSFLFLLLLKLFHSKKPDRLKVLCCKIWVFVIWCRCHGS